MKRFITSALIIALTIGAAQAQDVTPGKHHGQNKEQKMGGYEKLNLTADQKARLKSIRENFEKQMTDLNKQDQLTVADMKSRRQALHQQYQSQFESILTPEQKTQYEQMRTQWKQGRDGNARFNKEGKGRRGGADFQKELNLTSDQQKKVEQIRSDFRTKFEALRNDNSLTQDQKKSKMQELRKQQQDQMKMVLTPEQIQKMQSLRKQHKPKNL